MAATAQAQILVWTVEALVRGVGARWRVCKSALAGKQFQWHSGLVRAVRSLSGQGLLLSPRRPRLQTCPWQGCTEMALLRAHYSFRFLNIHSSLGSTSSSGQDVALWPRQPMFKSWCGQAQFLVCAGT